MADEFRHRRRRAHDIWRVDRRDMRHARTELGGLDEAHVERAGLQLLHHRRFIAELAGVKHRHGQAAVGGRLEIIAKFQRRLVPGMAIGRDEAKAKFLGLGKRQRRREQRHGCAGGKEAATRKGHGKAPEGLADLFDEDEGERRKEREQHQQDAADNEERQRHHEHLSGLGPGDGGGDEEAETDGGRQQSEH